MERGLHNLLWDMLEDLGEDEVRRKLAIGDYPDQRPLVEEWLRYKEQQRTDEAAKRNYTAMSQQTHILRSTKNAAWTAICVSLLALAVAIEAQISVLLAPGRRSAN
jgi:hypothetical protein